MLLKSKKEEGIPTPPEPPATRTSLEEGFFCETSIDSGVGDWRTSSSTRVSETEDTDDVDGDDDDEDTFLDELADDLSLKRLCTDEE